MLDVAARSFLENGYAGTTMSAIAATLGGSKGTLWSYFPSKEELFGAVIGRVTEAFRAQLTLILNPGEGDLEATLRRFCREFLLKVTSPEAVALHRLVLAEAGRFPEMGRIFYDSAPFQTQRLLAGYLESAMERGALRRADALTAARQLIGLCMVGLHQQLTMGVMPRADGMVIREDVEHALDTFLKAYRP